MVEKLTVRGEVRPPDAPSRDDGLVAGEPEDIGYRVVQRVLTADASRSRGDEVVELEVEDRDILEVTDTDGITTFLTAEKARQAASTRGGRLDLAVPSVTRGTGTGIREVVQSRISGDLAELGRGVADWGLDQLLDPVARRAVRALAERLDRPSANPERGNARERGLYRVTPDLMLREDSLVTQLPRTRDPFLVLLHGTFSNTEASFGGLLADDNDDWSRLVAAYPERVLALEHATLGLTPVENAVDLARSLPDGARLHLLSHSRGGLVGEVLSCALLGNPSTEAYRRRQQEEHPDVEAWNELLRVAKGKRLTVERFVRVACPARGTILASRKVDTWANYFFNALRLVPGMDSAGALSVVKKVVLVLLEQHVDVRAVPGLECMVPESALVATLAGVEQPVDDGLVAVTGDVEGKGILGKIALALPDLFFEGQHDLVVNTNAMDGGMPRLNGVDPQPFRGPAHTHFGYFRTTASRQAITAALVPVETPDGTRGAGGTTAPEGEGLLAGTTRGVEVKGPTLVIVPDLMGSVLHSDEAERTIWPAPGAIARRGVGDVLRAVEPERATIVDPVPGVLVPPYDELISTMRHNFVVRLFPYDWRRSKEDLVGALHDALLQEPASPDDDAASGAGCIVLGHGFGAALALEACGDTGFRPLLLDPPFEKRPGMVRRAAGDDDLTEALALVDGGTTAPAVGELLSRLEAFGIRRDGWKTSRPTSAYPLFVCVHDNAHAGHGLLSLPCQHYLSRAPAGSILTSPEVLRDLRLLALGHAPVGLVAGQPSASPPPSASQPVDEAAAAVPKPAEKAILFPTADDLARMALGIRTVRGPQPLSLLVRVTHGDLRVGDGPWVVGAQDGTPIGGSEKALDQRLDGALSTHRTLGQYPGPLGSLQLFTGPDLEGAAAAVIGMGAPGELTPGQLTTGVTQAVLRLAAANVHVGPVARQGRGQANRGFHVSCVLIGTVGPGALPIDTAVSAIITGVRRANRTLRDLQKTPDDARHDAWESPPVVGSLQLIELYEDRAVLALDAATSIAASDGTTDDDVLQTVQALQLGVGGRKGSMAAGYLDDRWRTIRVTASAPASIPVEADAVEAGAAGDGAVSPDAVSTRRGELVELTFMELGRNAGAETTVNSAQRRVIDQVIQRSIHTDMHPTDPSHNTLYELLVPLHMKGQGRPSDNIMFILDEHAASLPLEMLATRSYDDAIVPIAADVGIVRRLETTTFRQWVRPASGSRALVIGDPRAPGWRPLPGARLEANRVARALERHGYTVERQISASDDDRSVCTTSIVDALYAHDYRIIHIAAHGDIAPPGAAQVDARGRPGVVIGRDDWLTAVEIQQMQTTPDLVFLNCCHLGSALGALPPPSPGAQPSASPSDGGGRPDRFAAGIARQLIDNGVRGVVAAGWAVADDAAATFATTFYEDLLTGHELGPATLEARREVMKLHPDTSTWGAYQVYGPPALTVPGEAATYAQSGYPHPKAVRDRLAYLARQSARLPSEKEARRTTVAAIRADLGDVVRDAPPEWIDGEALQTIGETWRNLGCYTDAITSFRAAMETWSSVAALNVVDQLVSAHVRLGAEHARNARRRDARASFRQARQVLDAMDIFASSEGGESDEVPDVRVKVGTPPERLKLSANYAQHELWLHIDDDQVLEETRAAFGKAAESYERLRRPDRYCRLGEITLRWVQGQRGIHTARIYDRDLDTVAELLASARRERWSPKPFAQLGAADCLLVDALLRTPTATASAKETSLFAASVFDVADAYRDAFRKGLSERERASVTDYLELLQRLLPTANRARQELLKVVADELEARAGR